MKQETSQPQLIEGPTGKIELLVDTPENIQGLALVAHPHPLFGGANTNKVTYTLARTLRDLGYVSLRPNFRGVGHSEGEHDHGGAETEDLLSVLDWGLRQWQITPEQPIVLAGFSFGAFVQTRVARRIAEAGRPAHKLILVSTAAGYIEGARSYATEAVPEDALVIHGSKDVTVPLANVLAWAEPLGVPLVVIPGGEHFFHGRLQILRDIVMRSFGRNT